ncbi:hypothetical protein L195_g004645 [Trifolium pratense]|uniref:Uncharacterized protein n=1 Tax=Trifolium pratense TaxID=57577 RepID=A0A2K3NYP2_TRIPR|nr:hypothetical protein L195_g004645 [Trifolium pratense]
MLSGTEKDARMRMDDSSVEGGGRGREKVVAKIDDSKPESRRDTGFGLRPAAIARPFAAVITATVEIASQRQAEGVTVATSSSTRFRYCML